MALLKNPSIQRVYKNFITVLLLKSLLSKYET